MTNSMNIIIAGDGEVGLHLAEALEHSDHNITIVDPHEELLKMMESHSDLMTIAGDSTSIKTLQKANVKRADMVIAVLHSGPTGDSWNYGHVGIYVGDDKVMHSTGKVEITSLEDWVNIFDPYHTVKWGFPPELKGIIEQEQKLREADKTQ